MKVGDEYSSYEEFDEALKNYKKSVSNEYWIRDARTIANQKRRFPGTVDKINESLRYYYLRFACVKGGRPFKSKNDHSSRKCTTLKQDCEATIFLRLSPCQKTLVVVELNEKHNHQTSKSYFDSLSQQRLKLPKTVKEQAKECLKAGADKKIVLNQIQQQTGCKITLKDLSNLTRRTEKDSFAECVDLLKNTYKCSSVEVWVDENSVSKGLYFQDERMKKYFEAFPEILFVDGPYCLVDSRTTTYIIMVENGNGLTEIVAVCLLVDADEQALDFFIENFKKYNPSWNKVQAVMSDKDRTERKVFAKYFPNAKLMICLFHVFQIFHREISVKKMNISTIDVQKSKQFLQKITYAESEHEYDTIYKEMIGNVPEIVKDYYETNWAPITDLWVKYLTFQNVCLSNTTNNPLESLNSHLKSVISRYSPLEDYIKHLFVYINSFRAGQDVKVSQMLNKRLAKPFETGSVKALYCELLTIFAYEKVEKQLELLDSCTAFKNIEDDAFLAISTEGLLKITPLDCECMFRKWNRLPCRHIFKCRKLLSLSLFESSLCLNRWTRLYSEQILQECESNLSNNFEMVETINTKEMSVKVTNTKPKSMTSHQKFKMIDDQGKMMAKLCSEVSTPIFYKRLEFIQNVIKLWSEGKDTALNNISFKMLEKEEGTKNNASVNIEEINNNKSNETQEDHIYFEDTLIKMEYIEENTQLHVSDPCTEEAIQIPAEQTTEDLKTEQQQISGEPIDRAAKVLKKTAVPSMFPWSPASDSEEEEPSSSPFDGACREQARFANMHPSRIDCEPDINVVLKTEPEENHRDTVHTITMSGSTGIKREVEIEIDFNVTIKKEREEFQEEEDEEDDEGSPAKNFVNVSVKRELDTDVERDTPKLCSGQSEGTALRTVMNSGMKLEQDIAPAEDIFKKGGVSSQTSEEKPAGDTNTKHAARRDSARSDEGAHECKVCHKHFGWSSKLREHMRKHTGEKPYPCNVCRRPFGRKSSLKIHFKNHSDDIFFECNICLKRFSSEEELNGHLESHEKRYKCDVCQSSFTEKSDLDIHLKTHTGKQPFKCNICQIKFVQKVNLQRHLKSHTGKNTFQCKTCYIIFNQRMNLLKHISKHTNDESVYVCDHCQHRFSEKSALRKHIRTHTGEKPFKCNICHLRFSQKINLQTHRRTHTGEKPYECNFCKKRFSRIHCLQIHVRTHTGEKPYECGMCDMRFARKAHMTAHVRIHTGEKPYECDVCKKRFTENSGLRKHYRTHTGEKPYECQYCECRFSSTKSMKLHACRENVSRNVMVPTLPELASSVGNQDPIWAPVPPL